MSTFFEDTFNASLSPGTYLVLEDRSPDSVNWWRRMQTGSTPNQNLINSAGRCFRSAYNPVFGSNHGNGSEHYVQIDGLDTGDYIVEAVFTYLGQYSSSGEPLDEPDGGGRSINATGTNNCDVLGNESHARIQGRWTNNYLGYQLSYRASNGVWKLTVSGGVPQWPIQVPPNFGPGGHPLSRLTTMPNGIHLGKSIEPQDALAAIDRSLEVEYTSESAEIGDEVVDPETDPVVGDYDYNEGGIILAMKQYPIPVGQSITGQLRMNGDHIEARIIDGSVETVIGWAVDSSWSGVGEGESNLVGLRFDAGSSPVAGVHIGSFKVHNDFDTEPDPLDPPVITATLSGNTATVSWAAVPEATYYTVYRGGECGDSMVYIATVSSGTTYADVALLPGRHSYVVYAHDTSRTSDSSNCEGVTVTELTTSPTEDPITDIWRFWPIDDEDGAAAQLCTKCKRWVPQSKLAKFNDLPYCHDHVPVRPRKHQL